MELPKKSDYKILFIDLETLFNLCAVWRPGYSISVGHNSIIEERQIILAGYAWNDEPPKIIKWNKDPKSKNRYIVYSDKELVEKLVALMDKADLIVAQNGDAFDLKWLRGRAMKHGIAMSHSYQTFDTLKKSRQLLNINSRRLDYLGEFFLGEGKAETGGFGLWVACMMGDSKALTKMADYCKQDVNLLRKYYKYLLNYAAPNNHLGAALGFSKESTCPTCGTHDIRKSKEYTTKTGAIRVNMKCINGHYTTVSHQSYMKWVKGLTL